MKLYQHRKPIEDNAGNCIGFTDWRNGRGLPWWPHRVFFVVEEQE